MTLLGTGTSHGVPVLGCRCDTCSSGDPFDTRFRSAAYILLNGIGILIDTPPEFRLQAFRNRLERVDLVLMTHNHADHLCGFDDLRRFNELQGGAIPVYGNRPTLEGIRAMFPYIFDDQAQVGGGKPSIRLIEAERSVFDPTGVVEIRPVPVLHGRIPVYGYRIGRMAYVTDCSHIPDSSTELLQDLDLLVLGVLRYRPHPTHLNLEQGLELIGRLRPKRTIFTHIAHDFRHRDLSRSLPAGVEPGYDGMRIYLDDFDC